MTDGIRTPRQYRSIRTRNQIIEAALDLFSTKGYHSTNSKEIASRANVATGCFYSYFKDKKDVFVEALKIYTEQFNQSVDTYLKNANDSEKEERELLHGLIKCLIDAHKLYTGMHNELISMRLSDPDIDRILFENEKRSLQITYRQFELMKDKIRVSDLEAAAAIVYHIVHRVVDIIVLKQSEIDNQKLIDETVEMVYKYLFA